MQRKSYYLPETVIEWVKKKADSEGRSESNFLARLLETAKKEEHANGKKRRTAAG